MTPTPSDQVLIDIRERLVRIETQTAQFYETRDKAYEALAIAQRNALDIAELKIYAAENRVNAATAKNRADAACDDLGEMKDSQKWNHRTAIVLVTGFLLNLVYTLVQGIGDA